MLSGRLHFSIRDLSIFKDFKVRESQSIQFRFEAFNFLNHPLDAFTSGTNLSLQYTQNKGVFTQTNQVFGYGQYQGEQSCIRVSFEVSVLICFLIMGRHRNSTAGPLF